MSLFVLYRATTFGIRPAWAAGVRQRLSSRSRETLESIFSFSSLPLAWLSRLPAPRAAQTVLEAAQQIPAAERLPMLTLPTGLAPSGEEVLQRVAEKRRWSEEDKEQLVSAYGRLPTPPSKGIETMLTCWTDLETWGERYLLALQEYHRVFFQEEEAHLVPLLESALRESQRLAETLSPFDLLERLSRGVRLQDEGQIEQLILFPSWWVHPLVFLGYKENLAFVVFSARWHVAQPLSFEPPEELIQVFKALGDSTRLRILRYLSGRPLTPSELARRLRLRLPTILHHLQILRLAGLVQVMIGKDYEKRYALRVEALEETDRF
ncbi:MAG: helix-turn-helix domain-containing protein [Anaerolineales bacterium]|nr:helix-turn-helix domain-containing protein [Anaerolineales bacterium]